MKICMRVAFWLVAALAVARYGTAWADDFTVLSTPTMKSALEQLGPAFEQQTGHRLVATFDNAATLERQIEAGSPFDVAILLPPQIDALIQQDRIAPDSRAEIASAMTGMALRGDLPAPDISTVDAFRQALLGVQSLAWSPESASGAYLLSLLDRLGIADVVRPRLVPVRGGDVIAAIAKGSAQATVISAPNIVDVRGVRLVGLLPREVQHATVYVAGMSAQAGNAEAAKAFIRLFRAPETASVLRAKGLEPAAP